MRRCEREMVAAVDSRRDWHCKNTKVKHEYGWTYVYLFDNLIWKRDEDGKESFCLCGWDTVTTRSRLSALGVGVHRVGGRLYLDGTPINDTSWYDVV